MVPTITCVSSQGAKVPASLPSLLSPDLRDAVPAEANDWIKRLRLVRYDGQTMRERFTYRGDSLWWFTELYLHKMRRLDRAVSTILALQAARDRHAPARIEIDGADRVVRAAAAAFGRHHGIAIECQGNTARERGQSWASYLIGLSTTLSRTRARAAPPDSRHAPVVAFVHTAFWRIGAGADGPLQEGYVGPILEAVVQRGGAGALTCVGVGPRRNFRARRWWHPLTSPGGSLPALTFVEQLAPRAALNGAMALWRQRQDLAHAVTTGDDVRAAAVFRGCDLWDVLRPELTSAALLQWPWSARAMDEAGAALDALSPAVAVTYAEAGGWGRALVLETRRRKIPSVGLQHGFIYRHWLNYRHTADEMQPGAADAGFPVPDRTLVFDHHAVEHLTSHGHFPAESLRITGSARLDDLARRLAELRPSREAIRQKLGIRGEPLAVFAAKFVEVEDELQPLVSAAAAMPDIRIVIKPHPAETPELYRPFLTGAPTVSLAPATADLATLLAAADAVITMNSTVAIDGLVLGLPALVIGLPNNLLPFVDAGAMLGARSGEDLQMPLRALLYDAHAREALMQAAARFTSRYGMREDGHAADRAAAEILALARR
ncbi:MAG: hypothetical protein ACM4AI_02170 [Acidobacteriota bacterium]